MSFPKRGGGCERVAAATRRLFQSVPKMGRGRPERKDRKASLFKRPRELRRVDAWERKRACVWKFFVCDEKT